MTMTMRPEDDGPPDGTCPDAPRRGNCAGRWAGSILLVDSHDDLAWAIADTLAVDGHEVERVCTARDALALLEDGWPCHILVVNAGPRCPGAEQLAASAPWRRADLGVVVLGDPRSRRFPPGLARRDGGPLQVIPGLLTGDVLRRAVRGVIEAMTRDVA
ncbi:hypothetical protein [Falsiroseomonas sp. CW058]|uniref:hypothetical protein n=1 Tax=Falsiroseomonas sp. CW058 TaxID=3388664 RepID=UPI003D311368